MKNEGIKKIEILNELSKLATPQELPITFFKYCKDIWEAFNLGRAYQLAGGEETEDRQKSATKLGISSPAGKEN